MGYAKKVLQYWSDGDNLLDLLIWIIITLPFLTILLFEISKVD